MFLNELRWFSTNKNNFEFQTVLHKPNEASLIYLAQNWFQRNLRTADSYYLTEELVSNRENFTNVMTVF